MSRLPSLLILLAALMPVPSLAAHITDKLIVGLYTAPKAEGKPLQLLSSGTPIEVLRREDGFAEVRLADDSTGWVEAGYVTDEKPATAMLLETQARLRQMGLELAKLHDASSRDTEKGSEARPAGTADLGSARARIAELEVALAAAHADSEVRRRLAVLNEEVNAALQRLAATQGLTLHNGADPGGDDPMTGYLPWIVAAGMLLLGFAGGVAFIDYRIRRRYGGFRI